MAYDYLTSILNLCLIDAKGLKGHFQWRRWTTSIWLKKMRDFAFKIVDLLDGSSENKIENDTETNEYEQIDDQYCQDTRHHTCGELDSRGKSNGKERCDGQ